MKKEIRILLENGGHADLAAMAWMRRYWLQQVEQVPSDVVSRRGEVTYVARATETMDQRVRSIWTALDSVAGTEPKIWEALKRRRRELKGNKDEK